MNAVIEPIVEARLRKRISNLEAELERAQDRIETLEDTFGLREDPRWVALGLTVMEGRIMEALLKCDLLTREQMMFALYNGTKEAYDRDPKLLDVCKINRKLVDRGVRIETVWGRGRRLTAESKAALSRLNGAPATVNA
jgi:hypothetical protein